jgi:hypothetical protein
VSGTYGARRDDLPEVINLETFDFKIARDFCEISGAQLMKLNENGEWEEA